MLKRLSLYHFSGKYVTLDKNVNFMNQNCEKCPLNATIARLVQLQAKAKETKQKQVRARLLDLKKHQMN